MSRDDRLMILDGIVGVKAGGRLLSGPAAAGLWPELEAPGSAESAAGRLALESVALCRQPAG